MVLSTGAAHLFQESQDGHFGNASHAGNGINGNTFNKSRDYLGALRSSQPIHDVQEYDACKQACQKNNGMHAILSLQSNRRCCTVSIRGEAMDDQDNALQKMGGEARAKKLTPEQRKTIARN